MKDLGKKHPEVEILFETPSLALLVHDLLAGRPIDRTICKRPLVFITLPNADDWFVPASGWHLDLPRLASGASAGIQLFVLLDKIEAGGGGTLAIAGSHRLLGDAGFVRQKDVCGSLGTLPFFGDLLFARDTGGVMNRPALLRAGADVDGVRVQLVEMTGNAGDTPLHTRLPGCRNQGRPRHRCTSVPVIDATRTDPDQCDETYRNRLPQSVAGMYTAAMKTSAANGELSPDVAKAQACDEAGEHRQAINHLVAGVHKNDVEAITRLGKRLLAGDRAPRLPNDGIGFLVDASERGGAEAAALLSVLFGIGVSRRHDVAAALEHLVVAAERGWLKAQEQIAVLAGERQAASERAGAESWRQMAKSIDLSAWQTPPPGKDLNGSPLVRSFPDFLSAAACQWLIERARPLLSRALVYEPLAKKTMAHPTRTNNAAIFNVLDTDFVCVLMQKRMCACLAVPFAHLEPATVLHYEAGREIGEHFDFVDPNVPDYEQEIAQRGERIVTFLVYLNEDYSGGETEFPRLGLSHKGRAGEGLFFSNALADGAPDVRTLHAGRPTRRGQKWIVSQFVRNRPLLGLGGER